MHWVQSVCDVTLSLLVSVSGSAVYIFRNGVCILYKQFCAERREEEEREGPEWRRGSGGEGVEEREWREG